MQVTVSKQDLLKIVARCQGISDKKSTMPVLSNVLVNTTGSDGLSLSATDLNLAVCGSIPAKIEKEGAVAVGAKDLHDRVKMMPDGEISIAVNDTSTTILRSVGGSRRYTLHGFPGEEFPTLPKLDEEAKLLELDVSVLASLIAKTHFSISTDETRLGLNSALFEWEEQRVRMVTTDGHRLSKVERETDTQGLSSGMLIPLKGIAALRRFCDEAKSETKGAETRLRLAQSGPNAFFKLAGLDFSVKLVEAPFPPYGQVIPDTTERAIRVPRLALADGLRAVSLAASDRTGGVKLTVDEGRILLESESPESGEGFDEIPVDYNGEGVTIGFNARYFLDVLAAIDEEEVILGISGELDPAVVRPGSESTKESYLAVVMPMRI